MAPYKKGPKKQKKIETKKLLSSSASAVRKEVRLDVEHFFTKKIGANTY